MAFDFDAFAGAVRTLSQSIDTVVEITGIQRAGLTKALHRHALVCKKKWEAGLWKSAQSEKELGEWIWRERKGFGRRDETEILDLSREIPGLIRRNMIQIAKSLPASRGGQPPSLDIFENWEARRRVKELQNNGVSKDNAYKKIAKQIGVSAHTVRRVCDKRERARSRKQHND